MPQTMIKRAVEQEDYTGLWREHNRLFGDQTKAGVLVEKLAFDYGENEAGSKRTWPVTLPQPPSKQGDQ